MAEMMQGKSAYTQSRHLPEWVIEHMIALCNYAEGNGLTEFEAKLIDATEVALAESIAMRSAPLGIQERASQNGSNVVPFIAGPGEAA